MSDVCYVLMCDNNYYTYTKLVIKMVRNLGSNIPITLLFDGEEFTSLEIDSRDLAFEIVYIKEKLNQIPGIFKERHVSRTTYGKFLIPEILQKKYIKCLYIDSDVLIRSNLDEIFQTKLNAAIAATPQFQQNHLTQKGVEEGMYFNAGVILMDLRILRDLNVFAKFRNSVLIHGSMIMQDQDHLNLILVDNWNYLSPNYNLDPQLPIWHPLMSAFRNPKIVHFSGQMKPWNTKSNNKYYNEWQKFAEDNKVFMGEPTFHYFDFAHFMNHVKNKFGNSFVKKVIPMKLKLLIRRYFS